MEKLQNQQTKSFTTMHPYRALTIPDPYPRYRDQ